MKRELLGLCTIGALVGAPAALAIDCTNILFVDCFENYTVGDRIILQDCGVDGGCGDPSPATCVVGNRWAAWADTQSVGDAPVAEDPLDPNNKVGEFDSISRNPATSDDVVMEVNNLFPNGLEAGKAYKVSVDQYVPQSYEDCNCNSYYILLNTYTAQGTKNWSTQVHLDSTQSPVKVLSDFDDGVQRDTNAILGGWATIETIIVVDTDTQIINYGPQGGQLAEVVTKSWTAGVSGGGAMDLEAWDLYPNDADTLTYYDNMVICEIDPIGSCCLEDGTCLPDLTGAECDAQGGFYNGIGSGCGEGACPERGADGWIVDAPLNWDGSGPRGMGAYDECDIIGGPDDEWVVTIPWAQEWFFDACEFGGADGFMVLGTSKCDDSIAENDDNPAECGAGSLASALRQELGTGMVYVTIENPDESNPDFVFNITAQCPRLADTPGAEIEDEACGDDTNGGCNMDVPAFIDLGTCDDTPVTIRGTHWFDGATRDTDWYSFTVSEDTDITITGQSVFAGAVFGVILDSDTQDCEQVTSISPLDTTGACLQDPRSASVTTTLANTDRDGGDPDTTVWWLFSAPTFGGPVQACSDNDPDGQNGFTFTLECGGEQCGNPNCPPDFDFSGNVGFNDLLTLLAAWGPCEQECCPEDLNDNGEVEFNDLLTLLAAWGDCP